MIVRTLLEHFAGFVIVILLSLLALSLLRSRQASADAEATRLIAPYLASDSLDLTDPLQVTLFKESLRSFYPADTSRTDSILTALDRFNLRKFTDPSLKSGLALRGLTEENVRRISRMYTQFVLAFGIVVFFTAAGARAASIYKFMQARQGLHSALQQLINLATLWKNGNPPDNAWGLFFLYLGKAALKGLSFVVLFSPAYVLAYAFKTELDTASHVFIVLLGVVSNGLLMSLTNKFYTFLVHESRKGYVETAAVKGLDTRYALPRGIVQRLMAIAMPLRVYSNHVFKHIYMNASFQYTTAVKEHAAFLITGLIIIEMALNVQGHLCYELLRSLFLGDYEIAVFILLGIFLAVKVTEMMVDVWYLLKARRIS